MKVFEVIAPVERIATDPNGDRPSEGMALCLSGGGYRAMLFNLGALWRLNECGYLPRLKRVSSVSGGSITAAALGLAWGRLDFDESGRARRFNKEVAIPLRNLAGKTIDVQAVLRGLFGPGTINDALARQYGKHLYGHKTLQHLPGDAEGPRFVINATNVQSGALWRFSRPYAQDWRVGQVRDPGFEVAVAVAASSALPPYLSPAVLHIPASAYSEVAGTDLHYAPFTTRVVLTDGGVSDCLGIETAWKRFSTILVSDGGGKISPEKKPHRLWPSHTLRVLAMMDDQRRSRRKMQVMSSFTRAHDQIGHRYGAYWSTRSDIKEYGLPDSLECPLSHTARLADLPSRLSRLGPRVQEQLVNWGYAVCDAALRRYVDPALPAPQDFPYPTAGVG
ncbi:MAG TPA: patatin-like phospholipase family protein [Chloroflexia bacterium]|jgi:NTE family protein